MMLMIQRYPSVISKFTHIYTTIKENTASELLAWCSYWDNTIQVTNLDDKQKYAEFKGAELKNLVRNPTFTHYPRILFNKCK